MFKKSLKFTAAMLAASALMVACGGQAHAQQSPASNQVQVSSTKTMDLLNARFVSIAPGNSYIVDHNGVSQSAIFQHVEAVTFADAFKNYIPYGNNGVYLNLSQTTSVDCQQSASVISWQNGSPTVLQDGCAFSDFVKSYARR